MNLTKKYVIYIALAQVSSDLAKVKYDGWLLHLNGNLEDRAYKLFQQVTYATDYRCRNKFKKFYSTETTTEEFYQLKEKYICLAIETAKKMKNKNKYKCFYCIKNGGHYRHIIYFNISYKGKKQISFHTDTFRNIYESKETNKISKKAFKTYWKSSNVYNTHWDKKSSYDTIYNLIENINKLN